MMQTRSTGIVTLMALLFGTAAFAADPKATDLVKPSLLADTSAVQPGKAFQVGVMFKLAPKWHIYWSNSGDAGIPTTVEFHLPPGFTVSSVQYPAPIRIEQAGGIIMYGYSDEVMLMATVTPPQTIQSGLTTISADVNWLVCDEQTCLQGQTKLNLALTVGESTKPATADLFKAWQARVPVAASQSSCIRDCRTSVSSSSSGQQKSSGEVSIAIDWKDSPPTGIEWFPPARDGLQFGKPQIATSQSTTTIKIPFERFGESTMEKPLDSVVAFRSADGRFGVNVPVTISGAHQ